MYALAEGYLRRRLDKNLSFSEGSKIGDLSDVQKIMGHEHDVDLIEDLDTTVLFRVLNMPLAQRLDLRSAAVDVKTVELA